VAQAPEHVVENLRLKAKEAAGGKKKEPRSAPPGFIPWTKATFEKLIDGQPEPLVSRFQVTHGMLLSVLGREDGFEAMKALIRDSHGPKAGKRALIRHAFELFRSLYERKIVEFQWSETSRRPHIRVNIDLQEDFSLNQTLALYLLDTSATLDPHSPDYALDILTLIEAILESPDLILRKQLDRLKTEKMRELKAEGVDFDQRLEELEKLEHPKPRRDFIYSTFNIFRDTHPWVGEENIRPKSIAREMYENYHSFADYIREYDLQRAEGLLLRYLSETYKVLEQTIPEGAKNEELREMALYFSRMVREVDSSLLEDWERMRDGRGADRMSAAIARVDADAERKENRRLTDIERTRLVRNEVYRFIKALASGDFETAVALLKAGPITWSPHDLEKKGKEYKSAGHLRLSTDPKARDPKLMTTEKAGDTWKVEQIMVDPEEKNDWSASFTIEFTESGGLSLILDKIGAIE
jgi:hypothetical protein